VRKQDETVNLRTLARRAMLRPFVVGGITPHHRRRVLHRGSSRSGSCATQGGGARVQADPAQAVRRRERAAAKVAVLAQAARAPALATAEEAPEDERLLMFGCISCTVLWRGQDEHDGNLYHGHMRQAPARSTTAILVFHRIISLPMHPASRIADLVFVPDWYLCTHLILTHVDTSSCLPCVKHDECECASHKRSKFGACGEYRSYRGTKMNESRSSRTSGYAPA
jgi:hypothetical protein